MTQIFPNDCLQYYVSPWWEKTEKTPRERWRLAWALVRHVSECPYTLDVIGRTNPLAHDNVDVRFVKFDAKNCRRTCSDLPVAALPLRKDEHYSVQRAKVRPVLILATPGTVIEKEYKALLNTKAHHPLYLVAPYYGADQNGLRAGIPEVFASRIKGCAYSQYMWEKLPENNDKQSILRLDQIQPIEPAIMAFNCTHYRLSEDAGLIMDEWLQWHLSQLEPDPDGLFIEYRNSLAQRPAS